MVRICGQSENRNVGETMWSVYVVSVCGQGRGVVWPVCGRRIGLWAPFRPRVKYWNLKQEGPGEDDGSGWVINDPTAAIRPTVKWGKVASSPPRLGLRPSQTLNEGGRIVGDC